MNTEAFLPSTFSEVLLRVRQRDAEFAELNPIPLDRLEVTEAALIFDRNSVPLTQECRLRLLEKAGAPVAYLKRRGIDVQIVALRDHFQQRDFGDSPRLVLCDGYLFTIRRDDLVELAHSDVLNAVAESLGNSADGLNVSQISYADGRLELDLVSPLKAIEVRPGDVVKAGLHIEHARFGDGATQIHAFVHRLLCSNGMTRRQCVSEEGIVRIRKLPASHPRARDLVLDQVRRLTDRTWRDLEPQLRELRAISERRADVPQLLRQWIQRARFSERTTPAGRSRRVPTVMDRLLAGWRNGGSDDTYYGAVNALTWVGSHDLDLSPHQRRLLSLLGGQLAFAQVHLCPRCSSVLSGLAQNAAEPVRAYSQELSEAQVVDV
jgi:hypothetical protein